MTAKEKKAQLFPCLNFLRVNSLLIFKKIQFSHKDQILISIALTLSSSVAVPLHYGIAQCALFPYCRIIVEAADMF